MISYPIQDRNKDEKTYISELHNPTRTLRQCNAMQCNAILYDTLVRNTITLQLPTSFSFVLILTHLQRGHGKGVGTNLVGQKDRRGNRSVSVAVGFDHHNDGTHLPVGRAFDLGIVVRQRRQPDLVDGPVQGRVHDVDRVVVVRGVRVGAHGVGTPGSDDNVADGRSVPAGASSTSIGCYRHGPINSTQCVGG